jgi:hypothetical protein
MRHLFICVAIWCGGAAHTWGQADFSHWRWWFLASTTDSATTALYDSIQHRYLHVSDLRVLREDLEPLYIKLSDSVVTESDAQSAALLIRLFHYSAARPKKTATYVDKLSSSLMSYLQSPAAKPFSLEVGIDLYVACDIATSTMINVDAYYEGQHFIDYAKMASVIDARVQNGSVYHLNRFRFLVQSLDAVTKYLEYNGVIDTTLVSELVSKLAPHLDTLDMMRQPDLSLSKEWHILLRHHLAIKARLYRDHAQHWKSEEATNALTLMSAKHESAPSCMPEARLRSTVLNHQLDRPTSAAWVRWIGEYSIFQMLPSLMLLESAHPALSRLYSASILETASYLYPVSLGGLNHFNEPALRSQLRDSVTVAKQRYTRCYDLLYISDKDSWASTRQANCTLEQAHDNLMYDGNYIERRIRLDYAAGQVDSAASSMILHAKTFLRHFHRMRPNHFLFAWADECDLVSGLDRVSKQCFYSAYAFAGSNRLKMLVQTTNPWSSSSAQNDTKAGITRALRVLDTIAFDDSSLLHSIWVVMTKLRGEATNVQRHRPAHATDTLSAAWKSMTPLARLAITYILQAVQQADLAGYIAGERKLDNEAIRNVEFIGLCLNSISLSHRAGLADVLYHIQSIQRNKA